MAVTAETGGPLDELLARQQALSAELREVEHWRRLVAARLDLAVAAVTDIDELAVRALPRAPLPPYGLRALLGIPPGEQALTETAILLRLPGVLADLEAYAEQLRLAADRTGRQVLALTRRRLSREQLTRTLAGTLTGTPSRTSRPTPTGTSTPRPIGTSRPIPIGTSTGRAPGGPAGTAAGKAGGSVQRRLRALPGRAGGSLTPVGGTGGGARCHRPAPARTTVIPLTPPPEPA